MKRPVCKVCGLKSYKAYNTTKYRKIKPLKELIFFCDVHGILDKEGYPCKLVRKNK